MGVVPCSARKLRIRCGRDARGLRDPLERQRRLVQVRVEYAQASFGTPCAANGYERPEHG
jgi:hypothetical protein